VALAPFPGSRRPRLESSHARVRPLRGESGQASAEQAGVIVVVVLLVLALVAGFTPLGARIASGIQCTVASVFSDGGGGGCGGDPAPPMTVDHSGDGSSDRPGSGANASDDSGSGGSSSDHSGSGANASGSAGSGGPQGTSSGGGAQQKPKQPVDRAKVDKALKRTREALTPGWFDPVNPNDLEEIERQVTGLNGAEFDAFIASMSDEELRTWIAEMEDGWSAFGPDAWRPARRQQMWSKVLPNASAETVRRLAGMSHDLNPRYDDVDVKGKDPGRTYRQSQGSPFVDGVSPSDIRQGHVGDCWYIASLKSVAAADPSVIENAITDNGNGTYTVRLYHDGKPFYVTVSGDEVVDKNGNQYYAGSATKGEMWPQIMEKALASYEGSYGAIQGDWPSHGMELLTGKPSTTGSPSSYSAADLKTELDQGHAVAVVSRRTPLFGEDPMYGENPKDSKGNRLWEPLAHDHAYQVTAVDLGDPNDPSDDTVTVQNPWYADKPMTLPYEDWKNGFSGVYTNPVK